MWELTDLPHISNSGISNLREVVSCIFYTFHLYFFFICRSHVDIFFTSFGILWSMIPSNRSIHSFQRLRATSWFPTSFARRLRSPWTDVVSVGGSNAIKSGQTLLNGRSGCFFKAINGRRTIFVVMVVVLYLADILNLSRAILLTSRNQSIDQAVIRTKVAEPSRGPADLHSIFLRSDGAC